ncbi:MAG: hypothetical protein EBZ48_01365 [Proteobacteria bacterium]|nr:hypothetical protein [Pseudomonadota bacterium]
MSMLSATTATAPAPGAGSSREPLPQSGSEISLPNGYRGASPLVPMTHYLSQLPASYLQEVQTVARQFGPLPHTTRQTVAIPVAAHEEGATLLQTLRAYSAQSLTRDTFEIALLLNYPEGSDPTPSLTALEAWRKEQPADMAVVAAIREVPEGTTIGYLRKVLNDAVVQRVTQRDLEVDHLLLRSDADTIATHPEHLAQHLHLHATRSRRMLAVRGKLLWDPMALASDPLSAWGVMVWQISETCLSNRFPNPFVGGVNFSLRASTYATLGGYNPKSRIGEDVDLGYRVQMLSQTLMYPSGIIYGGPRSACATSARRIVALREFGDPPAMQWVNQSVGFDAHNRGIRGIAIPAPLPRDEFQARMEHRDFADNAAEVAFRTIAHVTIQRPVRIEIQRALREWLGLEFGQEVFPGVPQIDNPTQLRQILLGWYDKHAARGWAI